MRNLNGGCCIIQVILLSGGTCIGSPLKWLKNLWKNMRAKRIFKDLDLYSIKNYLGKIKDKEKIIECLKKNHSVNFNPYLGNNFVITEDYNNFFCNLRKKVQDDCQKILNYTISDDNWGTSNCYLSDKNNFAEEWHNHIPTSTVTVVYYFNIPNNKTSIDFLCEKCQNLYTYKPMTDELLILPNYLYHKPKRCYDDGYRISINIDILCKESSTELFSRLNKSNVFEKIVKGLVK